MKEISDSQILSLLETEAQYEKGFRLLMEKYQERLYWHVRRMVTTHEDTDDVIQNVFIKVYKNIHRFEAKSKLYTWLYRIATNETLTFLKKRNKTQTDSIDNEDLNMENRLMADTYIDSDTIQKRLQYALSTLPKKQRLVFNLRYYDEMPYSQISEVLETSVGALKASYHHAVKKVESYFKTQGIN